MPGNSTDLKTIQVEDGTTNSNNFFAGMDVKLKKTVNEAKPDKPKKKDVKKDSEDNDDDDLDNIKDVDFSDDIHDDQKEDDVDDEETEELSDEEEKELDGLESLINNFGNFNFSYQELEDIENEYDGNESIMGRAKGVAISIIEFIKDVFRWLYNLFNNKILRTDSKIKYAEQKRKINGIKTEEVKYPSSIRKLIIPSIVSSNPNWVSDSLQRANKFFLRSLEANKYLKKYLAELDLDNLNLDVIKSEVTKELGKIICGGVIVNNRYQSEVLPGNRHLTITIPDKSNNIDLRVALIDSTGDPRLKDQYFSPTSFLLDETIKQVKVIQKSIQDGQKNTSQLNQEFQKEINLILKKNDYSVSTDAKRVFVWLGNVNRNITSTILQYTIHCIDSGLDFYNQGVKNGNR